jgi:hypothetical protein
MRKRLFIGAVVALTLCAPCFAASAVSEAEIYQWLALWEKREGLEHRDIRLSIVRASELPRGIDGDVEWWEVPGWAHIRVVGSDDLERVYHETPAEARYEVQCTIIHELLHLVLSQLYDGGDGRGDAWLSRSPARVDRLEAITEHLAVMLLRRRAPGGVSVARYIARQINSGPWNPARDVRERVMLQVARAMDAATDADVVMLASR